MIVVEVPRKKYKLVDRRWYVVRLPVELEKRHLQSAHISLNYILKDLIPTISSLHIGQTSRALAAAASADMPELPFSKDILELRS